MFHSQVALLLFLTALAGTGLLFAGAFQQQQKAMQAVRERDNRLSMLIDRMNEGLATFDLRGVFTYVSKRFCGLMGYSSSELVGKKSALDIVLAADRARIEERRSAPRESAADSYEVRLVKKTGEVITAQVSPSDLVCDAGECTGTFGLFTDVTASKRAQDALRESEEKYRLLVENQTELVLRIARNGKVVFVSPSVGTFFANGESAIVGLQLESCIHEDDREAFAKTCRRAWEESHEPAGAYVETRVLASTGSRWLGWSVKRLDGCAQNEESLIVVARDITDRRRAEEQARSHLQQLAHVSRVASMGEMASAIAHEINQPLSAITNYSYACLRLLRSDNASREEALAAMERVAALAERAGEIVRRMRSFVRAEERQLSAASAAELVHDVVQFATSEASQSGVELITHCDSCLPDVLADPIQMQQVLLNLVRNAVEAIDSAPGRERFVHVTARRPNDGGEVEITVTDTGPGLRADKLEKVFEPFYTTKTDGIGIGLALSRSIVEAHGGRLWASSSRHGGATFHVTLPIIEEVETRDA